MKIYSIIKYTVTQNIRNRVYYILVIFAVVLIFVTALFSVLGGEQPTRIILDFGLTSIEFFALLLVIFSGVSLILEEIESKTIYLVLIRPIPKWYYVIGRYLGLLLSVYLSMILMYGMLILILFYKGWAWDINYVYAVLSSFLKIAIVGSLAVFFSLFSTSSMASLVFTFSIWILGHFSPEIMFLIKRINLLPGKIVMKVLYYIIPNLQYFNWRDYIGANVQPANWIPLALIYGIAYCAVFLCLSIMLFNRKEV